MIKKLITSILTFSLLIVITSCNDSKEKEFDSRAVETLDKLTEAIGELSSCSYSVDSYNVDEEGIETGKLSEVYLRDSNKLFIENSGTKGDKSFWYNGEKFAYFLYDKNEYDILDAPDNTLELIDNIHTKYGVYFPAADFLSPTLTDDILNNFDQLLYFGDEKIDDVNCVSIEASNDNNVVMLWVNKETNLPFKMVIISKINENKYFEANYSNWRLNPKLPDVMFEFQAPKGSERKKFIAKN